MPEDRDSTPATAPDQPAPADDVSSAGPGVRIAQGAEPADRREGEDGQGDSATGSPGAWTALAAPGKPDGEVDTRS